MKSSPPRPAALLLNGAAVLFSTALRAADKTDAAAEPAQKAPEWLKIVDQGDLDPRLKGYKTPEGIKLEIVAADPAVVNPVALSFGDDGTPYVLEQRTWLPGEAFMKKTVTFTYKDGTKRGWEVAPKDAPDVVKALDDSQGKGVYDKATVVYQDEVCAGILWHDGWLYVAGRGVVDRCKRGKDDGRFDRKERVAQGLRGAGNHQPCGLSFGPDGRLYISAPEGDNEVEGSDGSRATALKTGAVFRCKPDGSAMEIFAIGFVWPDGGLAFDAVGDAFQADGGGLPDKDKVTGGRLLHVVEGADFGWRYKTHFRPDPARAATAGELPGKLGPMLAAGADLQSHGSAVYDDTRFPENFRGLLLVPDSGGNAVHAYKPARRGGTFEVAERFDLLKSDDPQFAPTQAVVGPDGAVYVVDPRDGKHGRVLRLSWAGTKDQPALPPRGTDSWAKIAKMDDDDLLKALHAEDAGTRTRAREESARRGYKGRPALLKLFKDEEQMDDGRRAALGALESMWDADVQAACLAVLGHDSAADMRRVAADALGRNAAKGDEDVHAGLLRALNDTALEVRRAVAVAMARVGADAAPDNLVNTFAADDGRDVYLHTGLVYAVESLGKPGIERLVALGESGVQRENDRVVEAFTMTRTRPAADAVPRELAYPHLTASQRAALVRSYENYLLEPPVSLAPLVDFLAAHPEDSVGVKLAGAEVLAAGEAALGDKAAGWLLGLLGGKDAELSSAAVTTLTTLPVGPEDARRVGQAYLDGKLRAGDRPGVEQVLAKHAENDAECARLLEAVKKEK